MTTNELSFKTFKVPNLSKNWLDKNYFRYNKSLSSAEDGDVYTMRFPVMSWGIYVTIEAEIMLNYKDNLVHINCYDKGTRSLYAAWYTYYYGNYTPLITSINEVIYKKIKKLGLVEANQTRGEQLFEIPKKRRRYEKSKSVFQSE